MNKELYVSSTPHETKVALTEDEQLAEVFFERENEYTLAGSIYKGRVTRVLPGMQSAFVDIGLERDAFLYVSDFLEFGGEEDSEEFGEIPAPRGTVDLRNQQPTEQHPQAPEVRAAAGSDEEDVEAVAEEFTSADNGSGAADAEGEEETGAAASGESEADKGARRWRGRRRRGGRRGRGEDRPERPAEQSEAAVEQPAEPRNEVRTEPRNEPRSDHRSEPRNEPARNGYDRPERGERPSRGAREDFGPPAGYTPIVLPGESISKYRNVASKPAVEAETSHQDEPVSHADHSHEHSQYEIQAGQHDTFNAAVAGENYEIHPEAPLNDDGDTVDLQHGHTATEPEQLEWAAAGAHGLGETHQPHAEKHEEPEIAEQPNFDLRPAEQHQEAEVPQHTAPSVAHEAAEQQEDLAEAKPADAQVSSRLEVETVEIEEDETDQADFEVEQTVAHLQPEDVPAGNERHAAFPVLEAPSSAPEGRMLEHETLDDDEMEFHPVPEDLEALSEAAADNDLDLVEETLDADNGFGDRWIPKIADVDEDEVLAAEERGETAYGSEEEEDEEDSEEEETNGHAEVRATVPTAAFQQRQAERPGYDRQRGQRGRRGGRRNNVRPHAHSHRPAPLITDLLKEGQEVLIQIAKEPIGKKGARITSHIALPGRFLVYMPTVNHVGVSRKIASDEERQRLKRIVTSERENGLGGFIVRTAAANIKEEDLRADIRFLKHLWAEIKSRAESSKAPALIYHDLNLVERVLRDQVNADFSQIWVDTEDEYERVVRFANRFQPSLVRRIKLYTKETPLYEQFGIQEEIDRSLKSKVWLKSGGYIVINQTEALVAIDINTGKYVGKTQRLEDTIVKTNVDAIKEIVRQIRLRDLGGIIVIDFIDMDERKNRQKVMQALEEALRNDRAPSKVLQFNDFGLVAITRKRVKQSLERTLGEPCPYCVGAGFVKSVPTVCNEIYIEMRKMIKEHDRKDVTLRVHPEVAKALKATNGKLIGEMEELIGKTVLVKADPMLHQENFDIH